MIYRLLRQAAKALLGLWAMTTLSCERDTFYVPYFEPGEPVNVRLAFELPQKDQVAVTRTLTDKEEHHISDFYLLIFDADGNRLFGKYYYNEDLQAKRDYAGGEWKSVADDNAATADEVNSTHGYVVAQALTSEVYIFGFANIGDDNLESPDDTEIKNMADKLEGTAVKERYQSALTTTRYKLDHIANLNELYVMQIDAMSDKKDNILNRVRPNLMYSGAFRQYGSDLVQSQAAGKVNIKALSEIKDAQGNLKYVDDKGNIDLTSYGMIYLRAVTAHVNFHININSDVFSAFEPKSWQVVNLPTRVYLMDQGDATPVKNAEIEFRESAVMPYMLHDNGMFSFDFWMYENHKKVRDATNSTSLTNSLNYAVNTAAYVNGDNVSNPEYADQYLADESEVDDIRAYYVENFGAKITDVYSDSGETTPLPKLKTVYGYGSQPSGKHTNYGFPAEATAEQVNEEAVKQFLYAKREYQVKRRSTNTAVWNRQGDYYPNDAAYGAWGSASGDTKNNFLKMKYSSKKFVYADDKATYVVIKGRLRFKTTNSDGTTKDVKLINYAYNKDEDGYLVKSEDSIHDGYADVTYTIHLGNINAGIDNFNTLRNTEYNYTVNINGLNSIYTTVESNIENTDHTQYRVKKQPGADGMLNLAKGTVYNADAHFCQFNMMLTKAGLNDFYFEMHTPWRIYTTEEIEDDIKNHGYTSDNTNTTGYSKYLEKYGNNPDFNWFKFSPNDDQQGMFDSETVFGANEEDYKKTRKTTKYQSGSPNLWNLFTFTETMMILEEAQENSKPQEGENNDAVNTRMAGLLDSKFECTVGGAVYHGGKALPFLLDQVAYEVSETIYNEAVTNNNLYQTTSSSDGKYYITEDYVKYFKDHCSLTEEEKEQVSSIHRMFYTVYLDEYYYHTMPYGVTGWTNPYWKHFANQPSRFVNFGYHSSGETSSVNGYMLSPDKQSGIMLTQLTVVQPSIQTFYSTDYTVPDEVAIGLEHVNETHDPRWTDLGTWSGHDISTTEAEPGHNYYTYNGWLNTINYVNKVITSATGGTALWDYYVSDLVYDDHNGVHNNVAMRLSTNTFTDDKRKLTDKRNDLIDNPYLAGAIRMCLNRNRDENGDGKIDEEELKWFLPTARQYELANLGHYSLQDPLLEYNNYVLANGRQRLPLKSVADNELWEFRFVTSDYQILAAEQMTNSPDYIGAGWVTSPYDMRCMRNLGGETERNADGSTKTNVSRNSQSLVFDYNTSEKVFTVNLYDDRSVRGIYYDAQELPAHYLFSTTNLPYRKFKVAKDLVSVDKTRYTYYKEIYEIKPCYEYTEEEGGKDLHSWRTPNQAEMALMVLQLRQANESSGSYKVEEFSPAWFFSKSDTGSAYFLSGTSWNFTDIWGRAIVGNHDSEGWGMHMTSTKPNNNNIINGEYREQFDFATLEGDKKFYVRCVKDLME